MLTAAMASAQDYKTAIGIRGGSPTGITVKHFLNSNAAIEGILGLHYRGIEIVGLYEIHATAFQIVGLNWYYGGGAHVGSYNGYRYYNGYGPGRKASNPYYRDEYFVSVGVDGIIGLEYNIPAIPINISIDLIPTINLLGFRGIGFNGGLSARYRF